ncbi:MAG TPA: ubiquinol-cytochrome c reductase iron-sulfur subunit [Acidimicrobiales bacterium]|jgi:cytochrome b6-f complex iron-sulfur subunit
MLVAAIVVIGVLLLAALVLAVARRQDAGQAVGVLSRETRRRDRSEEAVKPLAEEAPVLTGRQVERQAALERSGRAAPGTSVLVAGSTAPVPAAPPAPIDMEALGVTRRQFLNRAILGVFGLSAAAFGTAMVGFLWPTLQAGGFGSVVPVGKKSDVDAVIATKQPFYSPQARAYINPYPTLDVSKAKGSGAYSDPIVAGMQLGYVALYQKCVHLGCRVPWCLSSQWFECPCHGSQYNRVGEKKGGPAPRGLDRFALTIGSDDTISVNTSTVYVGPPIGTNTTGQEAEGPHCR